jgi:hypothetical protein
MEMSNRPCKVLTPIIYTRFSALVHSDDRQPPTGLIAALALILRFFQTSSTNLLDRHLSRYRQKRKRTKRHPLRRLPICIRSVSGVPTWRNQN